MELRVDDTGLSRLEHSALVKKRAANNFWQRIRLLTAITVLSMIALGARLGLDLGTYSSFSIGPVRISCPLGVAQVMAASQTFIPVLALAGLVGIILTVLFGRAFCGWLCPGRWILNRGVEHATKPWGARPWIQSAIAGGVVSLSWFCHSPVFCVICPAGVACRGAIALGTGGSLLPTFGWLSGLVGLEWISGRSWCRDLCPLGGTITFLSRLNPFIKVKANQARCRPCVACERACPEGLNLASDKDFSVCTKCFACQVACPRSAVEISLV